MKRVRKSMPPPQELIDYQSSNPDATWKDMRDDNAHGGYGAAHACRDQAVADQKDLCAYCEQRISVNDPLHCQVEHFHQKSDKAAEHNLGLDWANILAVCDGGSTSSREERKAYPLPHNLSCDQHKNHLYNIGKLPADCEGYLINPTETPAFPNIFAFDKAKGHLISNEANCAAVIIPGNRYETTAEFVEQSIAILNLNCERLAEKRLLIAKDIENNKAILRKKDYKLKDYEGKLISRYFGNQWPAFFTTIRCCLGAAAENYLESSNYTG